VIGLEVGKTYRFKISARNDLGSSDYSSPISILAAQQPDKPATPTTTVSDANVVITWTAPPSGGSDITGYTVTIKTTEPNAEFKQQLVNCDGSKPAIRTATSCTVPILSLRSQPFNLAWGSSIQV